jgi:hypothetical protein
MGILDEAIREHLELKRSHGADDSEIKELEDDAFGPPQRPGAEDAPDPAAEAATEFMSQPDFSGEGEQPQAEVDPPEAEVSEEPPARRQGGVGIADLQEAPISAEQPEDDEEDDDPAAEEPQPAAEHKAITDPIGPTTEERRAIADQPTEMFDVQEEFASSEAPADEELVAEEIAEPRLAPAPDPLPEPEEDEEDDFFDEQRLSDELDQALEAPLEDEEEEESAEHEVIEVAEKPQEPKAKPDGEHDALEETPDFLEQAPEDDELWFEQKPPKDFDFDD